MTTTTIHTARHNDQVFTRTSKTRTYSHVVLGRRCEANALSSADKLRSLDASNYRYFAAYVDGSSEFLVKPAYRTDEEHAANCAKDIERAKRALGDCKSVEEYQEQERQRRIAAVKQAAADGVFNTFEDLGWTSRLDLAQKLANSKRDGYYAEVVIVEAERTTKEPKGKTKTDEAPAAPQETPEEPKTNFTITFDEARPSRRSAAATQCGYSVIEDDGTLVNAVLGKTYNFTVCRIFDKRAAPGDRVEWHVELQQRDGRRLAAHTLPAARLELLRLFKARIQEDNAAKDAAGELTPRQAQARGIAKIAKAEQEAKDISNEDYLRPSVTQEQLEQAQRLGGFWLITYHYADQPLPVRTELVEAQDHAGACGRFRLAFPSPATVILFAAKVEEEATSLDEVYLSQRQAREQADELIGDLIGLWVERTCYTTGEEIVPLSPQVLYIIWANNTQHHPSPRAVLKALKAGELVETQQSEYLLVPDRTVPTPPEDDQEQQTVDQRNATIAAYAASRNAISTAPAPKSFAEPTDEDQEAACRGLEVLRERAEPEDRLNTTPVIAELTWEDCKTIAQRNGNLSPHAVLKGLKDGSVIYTSLSRYVLVSAIQHPSENAQAAIDLALATRAAQEAEEKRKDALAVYRSLNRPIAAEEAPEASPVRSCA